MQLYCKELCARISVASRRPPRTPDAKGRARHRRLAINWTSWSFDRVGSHINTPLETSLTLDPDIPAATPEPLQHPKPLLSELTSFPPNLQLCWEIARRWALGHRSSSSKDMLVLGSSVADSRFPTYSRAANSVPLSRCFPLVQRIFFLHHSPTCKQVLFSSSSFTLFLVFVCSQRLDQNSSASFRVFVFSVILLVPRFLGLTLLLFLTKPAGAGFALLFMLSKSLA